MTTPNLITRLVQFLFGKPALTEAEGIVVSISDGDTLKLSCNGTERTLRLFGVDTPETAKPWRKMPGQPFGQEAKSFLQTHLPVGSTVFFEPKATDKYGRTVALVFASKDTPSINEELLRHGLAWYDEYGHRLNPRQESRKKLQAAFEQAKTQQIGLWRSSNSEAPHVFRKRMSV